jgi:hypothetical protein
VLNYTVTINAAGGTATLLAVSTDPAASLTVGLGKSKKSQVTQLVPIPYGSSSIDITVLSENLASKSVYNILVLAPQSPPSSPLVTPNPGDYPPPYNPPALPPPPGGLGPTVRFASGPPSLTSNLSGQVSFYATEATGQSCTGCSFYCALDSAPFQPCTFAGAPAVDPLSQQVIYSVYVTSVSEGAHSFHVRASGSLGYISATATYSWVTDQTPPVTHVTANVPTDRPTSVQDVVLTLAVTDLAPDGVTPVLCPGCISLCSMDHGTAKACSQSQPINYNLGAGLHTFAVRSMDLAGNEESPPVEMSFTVSRQEIQSQSLQSFVL